MFSWVSGLIDYEDIVIDNIVLENVHRSDQKHFNQLNQDCNQLHCS